MVPTGPCVYGLDLDTLPFFMIFILSCYLNKRKEQFMYAVVETGGKQYRVSPGDIVRFEKIDKPVGEKVELDKVLLVSGDDKVSVGETLKDAKVIGEVAAQGRERKVIIFKKKRRKGYQRTKGHRQYYTSVKITEIQA